MDNPGGTAVLRAVPSQYRVKIRLPAPKRGAGEENFAVISGAYERVLLLEVKVFTSYGVLTKLANRNWLRRTPTISIL